MDHLNIILDSIRALENLKLTFGAALILAQHGVLIHVPIPMTGRQRKRLSSQGTGGRSHGDEAA